jgi:hypothetical protein
MIKTIFESVAIIISIIVMVLAIGMTLEMSDRSKVINCSLSEFHPDFTTEMREACRKARMNKI